MIKAVLLTFFMSMLPVVELRGAIPVGVASGLPPVAAFIIAFLGNLVPVPFIIVFIRKIFAWIRTKSRFWNNMVTKMETKAARNAEKVLKYESIGLFILVAVPLPGTGAWTGSLVAAFLDMRLKRALPSIVAGVAAAGIIVYLITYGVTLAI